MPEIIFVTRVPGVAPGRYPRSGPMTIRFEQLSHSSAENPTIGRSVLSLLAATFQTGASSVIHASQWGAYESIGARWRGRRVMARLRVLLAGAFLAILSRRGFAGESTQPIQGYRLLSSQAAYGLAAGGCQSTRHGLAQLTLAILSNHRRVDVRLSANRHGVAQFTRDLLQRLFDPLRASDAELQPSVAASACRAKSVPAQVRKSFALKASPVTSRR